LRLTTQPVNVLPQFQPRWLEYVDAVEPCGHGLKDDRTIGRFAETGFVAELLRE
jgi:hypothetical protein